MSGTGKCKILHAHRSGPSSGLSLILLSIDCSVCSRANRYSTDRFRFSLLFVLVFINSPFSIVITWLREVKVGLCASRDFARVDYCPFLFLLVSGVGYGLWLWHSLNILLTFFSEGSIEVSVL